MLRPVSLSDHVSSWLPGWPAVTPSLLTTGSLCFVAGQGVLGKNGGLERGSLASFSVVNIMSNGSGYLKGQLQRT